MGVPGLYRWFVQRYPMVRRRMNDTGRPKMDNFYVDFNCIVYNALNVINSRDVELLLKECCRYLDILVQIVQPQSILFIAVDGPAPLAKCCQQRARRFVAARDSTSTGFSTTSISVGTEFMEMLHRELLAFIAEKTASDPVWSKPHVIYSSHRSPGEAEHKFFSYMRSEREQGRLNENLTHCVYSPDADLIFLCLNTGAKNIHIMKEWISWMGPNEKVGNTQIDKLKVSEADFELLHLGLAREYMKLDYSQVDVDRLISDFTAFGFLLGNDFIPHFPDVSIQSGDFETIVNVYTTNVLARGKWLVQDGSFNKQVVSEFLMAIVEAKNSAKNAAGGKQLNTKGRMSPEQFASTYLQQKYPEEYAKDKVGIAKKLTHAVMDGFNWVLTYYTKGVPSWTWSFPYHYVPPLYTVAKHCLDHESTFVLDRPPLPFEQLLCIYPRPCAKELPHEVAKLMFDPSPIAHYYPNHFEIDLNGRKWEHEGVVLLPLIDVYALRKVVADSRCLETLTPEEAERNTIIGDTVFYQGESKDYNPQEDLRQASEIEVRGNVSSFYNVSQIPFVAKRMKQCVNIFNKPSDYNSILITPTLTVPANGIDRKLAEIRENLFGKIVLVDWPHLRPAKVIGFLTENAMVPAIRKQANDKMWCKMEFNGAIKRAKQECALDLSGCKIMLIVEPVQWTSVSENTIGYSHVKRYFPYELTVPVTYYEAPLNRIKPSPEREPEVYDDVVIVSGDCSGKQGRILEVGEDTLKVQIMDAEYARVDSAFDRDAREWVSMDSVAVEMNLSNDGAQVFFSSLTLAQKKWEDNFDIAFSGFSQGRVLAGHVRKENGRYQFTKDFKAAAIDYLSRPCTGGLRYHLSQYSLDDGPKRTPSVSQLDIFDKSYAVAMTADLKSLVTSDILPRKYFLVDESTEMIAQTTLETIEHEIGKVGKKVTEGPIITIKKADAVWPGRSKPFVQQDKRLLGKRVTKLSAIGIIPFGATGTIVGHNHNLSLLDIVLDEPNEYTHTLGKRLRTKRGYCAKLADVFIH